MPKDIRDLVDDLFHENRRFPPPASFTQNAIVKNDDLYKQADQDYLKYWENCARELDWFKPWDKTLEWKAPFAKWFIGGKLNASYNCLDRHIKKGLGEKLAIIWEAEDGKCEKWTYQKLYLEVNKLANSLKTLGVKKGDRVAIYLPMIPQAAAAMLACARIGAAHNVIFGGFSVDSLKDRINDAQAVALITADGGSRRGKIVPLKETSDQALEACPTIKNVIVYKRTGENITMKNGRDHWYHDVIAKAQDFCEPEQMESEDLLFILYTSGTTGKPKGIIHTTGGFLTGVYQTTKIVFDLKPADIYWCTADVGWVTGHSYIVYGPMANGATQVMFEGVPDFPKRDRFWEIIEKYKVTILYTAPTAIRTFMKWGKELPQGKNLSSLRLLGSVGEPINPEAWMWYHETIGSGKCPIVDTWWQTETGAIMISPLPGVTTTKPGCATRPLPGIKAEVLDEQGNLITHGGGYLALSQPWPSMLRGIWGNEQRYRDTYWSKWDGKYFPGDGTKRDEDGYLWLLGRVDDVMNVAGHNIGTSEVESALVDHPTVAESAVVGVKDEMKGEAIAAFVILKEGNKPSQQAEETLKEHVAKKIGAIARPKNIIFTADLPKTRSGKIMRRLLRDIAEGRALGDVTTLADPSVIQNLKQQYDDA